MKTLAIHNNFMGFPQLSSNQSANNVNAEKVRKEFNATRDLEILSAFLLPKKTRSGWGWGLRSVNRNSQAKRHGGTLPWLQLNLKPPRQDTDISQFDLVFPRFFFVTARLLILWVSKQPHQDMDCSPVVFTMLLPPHNHSCSLAFLSIPVTHTEYPHWGLIWNPTPIN